MKPNIMQMSKRELREIPYRGRFDVDIGEFDCLVIVPNEINYLSVMIFYTRNWLNNIAPKIFKNPELYEIDGLHDSGWRSMDFVACKGLEPLYRLSGCSDVIDLDGIGGYGESRFQAQASISPKGWSIDCLPKSGLLRIFSGNGYKFRAGPALSTFEIFAIEDK